MPPPTLEYRTPLHRRPLGWPATLDRLCGIAAYVLVGGMVLVVVGLVLYAAFGGWPRETNRQRWERQALQCSERLRQIGIAIDAYASRHDGQRPDSFVSLMHGGNLSPHAFNCPLGPDEPAATSAGFQGTEADSGFIYVGDRVTTATRSPDVVIAYDRLNNHDRDHINVLFADGHVEAITFRSPANRPMATTYDPVWSMLDDQFVRGIRPVMHPVPAAFGPQR